MWLDRIDFLVIVQRIRTEVFSLKMYFVVSVQMSHLYILYFLYNDKNSAKNYLS